MDTYSPRIRDAVGKLGQTADDDWRAIALAGVDPDAAEDIVQAITQGHKDAAQTLDAWFRPGSGQAPRLRRQVRDAVTPLLRGSRALLATGGRVTRRAELLRIAAAIESADSDRDAWRVWCAATGLWGARHLSGAPTEPDAPARTSFWEAPAVPVDVTLRKRGTQSVKGRPAHVPNHRAARQAARQAAETQRAAAERAEQVIAARSGAYLAEWPEIASDAEAAIIWDLLAAVLRTRPRCRRGPDHAHRGRPVDRAGLPRSARPAVGAAGHARRIPGLRELADRGRPGMNAIGRDSARAQAQEAFVGLLTTPLLAARIQPTLFGGVLRHRATVSDWAARLGYRLVIAGSVARLHRDPVGPGAHRGAAAVGSARPP